MSQNFTPAFVYRRKRPCKDLASISETEPPDEVKPHHGISQLSTSSTKSQNCTLNFLYQRKSPHKDPISIFKTEPPDGAKLPNGISQLSTSSTMSRNFTPTFIYQRKRPHKNLVSTFKTELPNGISQQSNSSSMPRDSPTFVYRRKRPCKEPFSTVKIKPPDGIKPSDGCQSAVSSEAHAFSISEHAAEGRLPAVGPVKCSTVPPVYTDRYENREESGFGLASTCDVGHVLNTKENFSSSKSNFEVSSASLKFNTDDLGECSSSGALIDEKSMERISSRDVCISILRSQGLLDKVWNRQNGASNKNCSKNYCSRQCRVCERTESTQNMLICDNCEAAFHVSCYNPRITVLPAGEWLCSSCLIKKRKILKDKLRGNSTNIRIEIGRNRCLAMDGDLGSLEFMFRDTEPYMSNVRIGDEFQVSVRNWSSPIHEECSLICDAMELDSCVSASIKGGDPNKPLNLSSIGNWLHCRGVIEGNGEGTDGKVCAKWRRAPLFEIQTDNWECFDSVLWDPAHADCAVPQELHTDEVMKQLKYLEMLRPRLAAKRHA